MTDGMRVRREVLGDDYVDRAVAHGDPLSEQFQRYVTERCWGDVWTDPRLGRRERSLLTLGMTAALGRFGEFETHVRGAINNGVSPEELAAVLQQITVYCGVPVGVSCAKAMRQVLYEGGHGTPA